MRANNTLGCKICKKIARSLLLKHINYCLSLGNLELSIFTTTMLEDLCFLSTDSKETVVYVGLKNCILLVAQCTSIQIKVLILQ